MEHGTRLKPECYPEVGRDFASLIRLHQVCVFWGELLLRQGIPSSDRQKCHTAFNVCVSEAWPL